MPLSTYHEMEYPSSDGKFYVIPIKFYVIPIYGNLYVGSRMLDYKTDFIIEISSMTEFILGRFLTAVKMHRKNPNVMRFQKDYPPPSC